VNEEQKKQYHEKYLQAKQKGVKFWPDIIYKDMLVSFAIFILLIGLATFVGITKEPPADPSDSSYLPRPEWYFLFLFKFLALYGQIPILGKIEWIAAIIIPSIGIGILALLPFIDKSPYRHHSRRLFGVSLMSVVVVWIVLLTILAGLPVAPHEAELKISNALQAFVGLWIPGAALVAMLAISFFLQKNENITTQKRTYFGSAGLAAIAMVVVSIVVVSRASYYPKPEAESVAGSLVEEIAQGQDLYSIYCTECHGPDGEGGIIEGVEGLEGVELKSISSMDEMWTRTDDTLFLIAAFGQQDLGMPPFGLAYGGELKKGEIEAIVTFMRYTWDERSEIPEEAIQGIPSLAEGEVPSYEVHISAIAKRYCVSCHREGKENNNYLMVTYQDILTTGDNAKMNIIAGDPTASYVIRTMLREPILDEAGNEIIGAMPPTKEIKEEYIHIFEQWILNGMPETADEATALSEPASPTEKAPIE
jgi:mono/diheme cytochrome c family protein